MQYQIFVLESRGSYAILSAEEAWEILSGGAFGGRVWYREIPETKWAEWIHANPKFWGREYPVGQRADLFGPLQIFYPVDPANHPSIKMNDLVLEGDPKTLAEATQQIVDLIYCVPQLESISQEFASDPGYQTIQPIWRFKGHTNLRTALEAYVQAADDVYRKDIAGSNGSAIQ